MYDLFVLFILYFNQDYFLTRFINYDKSNEDTEYFKGIIKEITPVPDELLPFFYLKDEKSFMTMFYYEMYKDTFLTTYSLSTVQEALLDYDSVVSNMLAYYFPGITRDEMESCKSSLISIKRLIKESSYNSDIKSSLYAFFIEPIPAIQKLSYELMAKEFYLSQQYKEKVKDIIEMQNSINVDELSLKLKYCGNHQIDIDSFEVIYITVVPLFRNCVKQHCYTKKCILLLGLNSIEYMVFLSQQSRIPDLDVFSNALSEKSRIEILDLIQEKKEATIKDIEQELDFTGTNAYYHLSLMIKANLIKTRNKGRTVLYSINRKCFSAVRALLKKYLD